MTKLFQLKCDDFESNLAQKFKNLRGQINFTDVTLVCDDENKMFVHKLVLIASSEYFYNILGTNEQIHSAICLDGINSEELNLVLDYIYSGEIKIELQNIDRFRILAERFKLHGFWNVENQTKKKNQKHDSQNHQRTKSPIPKNTKNDISNDEQFVRNESFHEDVFVHQNVPEPTADLPQTSDVQNVTYDNQNEDNLRNTSVSSRITVMNEELEATLEEIQFTRNDKNEPNIYSCKNCNNCEDALYLAHRHYQQEHQNLDAERAILQGLFEFRKNMKKYLKSKSIKEIENEFQKLSVEYRNKLSELNGINEKILNPSLKEKYDEIKTYLESKVNTPHFL